MASHTSRELSLSRVLAPLMLTGLLPWCSYFTVTASLLLGSYGVSMLVDDLSVVLEVVGATGSTAVSYLLPGAVYLALHPEPHPKRYLAMLQLALGLVIMPVGLTAVFLKAP
jgi:amino acid permease